MARPQEFESADVLHRALGVFWRDGYEGTSLDQLLRATGLSKSSLYASFGNKRELFLKAFDAYRSERTREMHLLLSEGTGRAAVEAFFRRIIRDASAVEFQHGCMSTNQAVEMAPHDADVKARVEADFQLIEDALTEAIARGQRDGSVANIRDPRVLAELFVIAFPGFQVMVRAGTGQRRLERALETLLTNLD